MEQSDRTEASELSKNVCFTTQLYSQYQIYCLVTEAEESAKLWPILFTATGNWTLDLSLRDVYNQMFTFKYC